MASGVGRPSLQIDIAQVTQLRKLGMSMTKISDIIGVSRSMLYRGLENADLVGFTDLSDQQLDQLIASYKETHPHDGERMVIGFLRSQNIHVPRTQVRESIHRVDPQGVAARSVRLIQRKTYHVKAPNYLWHMDGNHKLIRYKFVIHGAVDGFSRLVTFLKCSTNNKAETVLQPFVDAVQRYGVPKKLRTDMGGENIDAWDYMIDYHSGNESCVITGSSVHNERIEQLWRDVSRSVIIPFKEIFGDLEEQNILDVDNDVDLYCLHEVFTDRINSSLSDFIGSWNSHPLTSENNQTPAQLFHTGNNHETSDSDSNSGSISQPTIQMPRASTPVEVNNLFFNPCIRIHAQIKVLAVQPSRNQGGDIYEQVAHAVGMHITNGCNDCTFP